MKWNKLIINHFKHVKNLSHIFECIRLYFAKIPGTVIDKKSVKNVS